jgi:hypothetical protein
MRAYKRSLKRPGSKLSLFAATVAARLPSIPAIRPPQITLNAPPRRPHFRSAVVASESEVEYRLNLPMPLRPQAIALSALLMNIKVNRNRRLLFNLDFDEFN